MAGLNHVSRHHPLSLKLDHGLTLVKASVGSMDNNAFLLLPENAPGVLIDAAAEPATLLRLIGDRPITYVITTHRHHDHIGALREVVGATGATALCGRPDRRAVADQTGVDCTAVWDGDTVPLGGWHLEVIGLVGHTPGAIALALSGGDSSHLFTGDSLFPGGVGKTATPADFNSLLRDVVAKLFGRFADETSVHPGHGDDTTLGAERPHLEEWRRRGW